MIEYKKDGKSIRLSPLYNRIKVGQKVILFFVSGLRGSLGSYELPAAFTVRDMHPDATAGGGGILTLEDASGIFVTTDMNTTSYLYDAVEWGLFQFRRQEEVIRRKQAKIDLLDAHLSMLRNILSNQGMRIVTTEQAEVLGLTG